MSTRNGGWMPRTLRTPFLCSLAGLFLSLFIVLEILRQYSERNNGLVLYKTDAQIPTTISVLYIYGPVSVSLLVVTTWNFVAADVLRLESFFQLSRPEGAPATVLFTNYGYCYGFMAPLTAARNRHWLVFSVSALSTVLRALLPAISSGLVVLTEVPITQTHAISTWPVLLDWNTQRSWFAAESARYTNPSVVASADNFFWLRSSDYASAPVSIPVDENESSILAVNQTVYWVNLACQDVVVTNLTRSKSLPASAKRDGVINTSSMYSWHGSQIEFPSNNSDRPCRISFALNTTSFVDSMPSQLRYWEPIRVQSRAAGESAFKTTNCEGRSLVGLLVDISNATDAAAGRASNATAFSCTATYLSAVAELHIGVNASILDAKVDQSSQKPISEEDFDIQGFQSLLQLEKRGRMDIAYKGLADLTASAVDFRHTSRLTAPIRSSVGPISLNSTARVDGCQYQDEISQYWKYRFITTMNKLFDPTTTTMSQANTVTIVVSLTILSKPAIIAEVLLLVSAILLLSLAAIYPHRANILSGDPGSIAVQCALIEDIMSPTNKLLRSSDQFDHATSRQLFLWAKRFRCEWTGGSNDIRLNIVPLSADQLSSESALPPVKRARDGRPHFVILHWFLLECILLIGVIVMYGLVMKHMSIKDVNNPSKQQTVFMISLIFGPTCIASLVNSLLATILRHVAMIEPWVRLQKGGASAKESLLRNHGSNTPVAVLMHSWNSGPPLLTALSVICNLGLLLSVVSAGMFEPQTRHYTEPATGMKSQYNGTAFQPSPDIEFDGYGLVLSNMNAGTPIVPWQVANYSFLPIDNNNLGESAFEDLHYEAITVGIGASLDCRPAPFNQTWWTDGSGPKMWNYTTPSGHTCTMEAPNEEGDSFIERSIYYLRPDEASSAESSCATALFILARWETMEASPSNQQNSLTLYCEPSILSADFEVVFDSQGVVSTFQLLSASNPHDLQMTDSPATVAHFNRAITGLRKTYPSHRNASFSQYDWPGMLTAFIYNRLTPSTLRSFDPGVLARAAELAYQQSFSTYFTLTRDMYFPRYSASAAVPVQGTVLRTLWGLMPSIPSMTLALILLVMDLIILVVVFTTRYTSFRAPRLPKSIGSLIPWIAESAMRSDFRGMPHMSREELQTTLDVDGRYYRFGVTRRWDGREMWALDIDDEEEPGHELDEIPAVSLARPM